MSTQVEVPNVDEKVQKKNSDNQILEGGEENILVTANDIEASHIPNVLKTETQFDDIFEASQSEEANKKNGMPSSSIENDSSKTRKSSNRRNQQRNKDLFKPYTSETLKNPKIMALVKALNRATTQGYDKKYLFRDTIAECPHTRDWRGPINFKNETNELHGYINKPEIPIFRQECFLNRTVHSSTWRTNLLLTRVPKCTEKDDYDKALDYVVEARYFALKAGKKYTVIETEALYEQLKGDRVLKQLEKARANEDFDKVLSILQEGRYHYKLMSTLLPIERSMPSAECAKREIQKKEFLKYNKPLHFAQTLCIEDGLRAKEDCVKAIETKKISSSI